MQITRGKYFRIIGTRCQIVAVGQAIRDGDIPVPIKSLGGGPTPGGSHVGAWVFNEGADAAEVEIWLANNMEKRP